MNHPTVNVSGYQVPLIGLPRESVIETCDLCGDEFQIREMKFDGNQFLCPMCRWNSGNEEETKCLAK